MNNNESKQINDKETRNRTVCFTGHRKIPHEQLLEVKQYLKLAIIEAIKDGYIYFGTGGALGFDTIAAQTVLELKEVYPQIKLILVLPCKDQAKRWISKDIEVYQDIKDKADKVVYISEEYTKDCMLKRNRHLVDNSSACICYCTKDTGGSAYTLRYAKENDLKIFNIGEKL